MSNWILKGSDKDILALSKENKISPILIKIMLNRGIEDFKSFLYSDDENINSYKLLSDIDKATRRIADAIDNNQKIRIVGDYDVDGICSTAILYLGLKSLDAVVDYSLPNREKDGYGINVDIIDRAISDDIDLIITCDNGIAAFEAMEYAYNKIDIVITDHHSLQKIDNEIVYPKADYIINPKMNNYPFELICGAFVAFKLVESVYDYYDKIFDIRSDLEILTGFATVCDVMPLIDENRIIVKKAIYNTKNTNLIGFKTLCDLYNVNLDEINVFTFGFLLGPALNSSGRLLDAGIGVELLICDNYEDSYRYAVKLKELNQERQRLTEIALYQAVDKIEKYKLYDNDIICVLLEDVHHSIAGIVAGRIKEKYYRPVLVFASNNGILTGSGRSIEAYDMFEELLNIKHLFIKCGGHKLAAGFSAKEENFNEISQKLNENSKLTEDDLIPSIYIDMQLDFKYINIDFINLIKQLEPYGVKNHKPLFAIKNVFIERYYRIGKQKQYLKLILAKDNKSIEAMLFNNVSEFDKLIKDFSNIDIVFSVQANEFNGKTTPQIIIEDFRKAI